MCLGEAFVSGQSAAETQITPPSVFLGPLEVRAADSSGRPVASREVCCNFQRKALVQLCKLTAFCCLRSFGKSKT